MEGPVSVAFELDYSLATTAVERTELATTGRPAEALGENPPEPLRAEGRFAALRQLRRGGLQSSRRSRRPDIVGYDVSRL